MEEGEQLVQKVQQQGIEKPKSRKRIIIIVLVVIIIIIVIWGIIGRYVTKYEITDNFAFDNYKCDFGILSSEDTDFDGENDAYLCWIWHNEGIQEISQEAKDNINDIFG